MQVIDLIAPPFVIVQFLRFFSFTFGIHYAHQGGRGVKASTQLNDKYVKFFCVFLC